MKFGRKLKSLRKGQKLTQQQLADRLGVAKSIISYYESGNRFPSYDVLIKIARTFHVTTDYLLDIERAKILNVSDLCDEDVTVLISVAEALRKK